MMGSTIKRRALRRCDVVQDPSNRTTRRGAREWASCRGGRAVRKHADASVGPGPHGRTVLADELHDHRDGRSTSALKNAAALRMPFA